MTNQHPIHQLHRLKHIAPDPAFHARSRHALLKGARGTRSVFLLSRPFVWRISVAGMIVVFLAIFISFLPSSSSPASALNPADLQKELKEITIDITLNPITYEHAVGTTVNSALEALVNENTSHLNSDILKSEENALLESSSKENNIDEMFDSLTQ